MPTITKTIELLFKATDDTGKVLTGVSERVGAVADGMNNVVSPISNAMSAIEKLDAVLVTVAAGALTLAASKAINFQASMADLEKVLGDNEGSAEDYKQTIMDLSTQFGVSSVDTTASAANFKQASYTMQESLELTRQSLIATNATELTAAQSSELFISVLAAYHAPASDAARILDVLDGVSNKYGVSVSMLAEGFKIMAPLAKQLGLSYEELAAQLTPIIAVNRSGSESGNALKTVYSNLINPTKALRDELENNIGVQIMSNGQIRNASDILKDVIVKTKDMTAEQRLQTAVLIAGADQGPKFVAFLSGAATQQKILADSANFAGAANHEFMIKTQTAAYECQRFGTVLENLAITVGDKYIKETSAAIGSTTGFVESLTEVANGQNAGLLFDLLRKGLSDFSTEMDLFAKNFPAAFEKVDLTKLVGALKDAGIELSSIFKIDANDPESIRKAIQFVVDSIESLAQVSAGAIDNLEGYFRFIESGVDSFNRLSDGSKRAVGETMGFSQMLSSVLGVVGDFSSGLKSIGDGLSLLAGASALRAVTSLTSLSSLSGVFSKLSGVLTMLGGVLGPIGLAVGAAATAFGVLYESSDRVKMGFNEMIGVSNKSVDAHMYHAEALKASKEGYKNMLPAIEQYKLDTGDMTINETNYIEKLLERAKQMDSVRQGTIDATGDQKKHNEELAIANKLTGETGDLLSENIQAMDDYSKAQDGSIDSAEKVVETNKGIKESTDEIGKSFKEAGNYVGLTTEQLKNLSLDDKLKVIKIVADINKEALDRKLELIKADLTTLQASFNSTGDVIVKMFDQLGTGKEYDSERLKQIEKENEMREKTLNKQMEMIDKSKNGVELEKDKNEELEKNLEGQDAISKSIEKTTESQEKGNEEAKEMGTEFQNSVGKADELSKNANKVVDAIVKGTNEQKKQAAGINDTKNKMQNLGDVLTKYSSEVYKAKVQLDIANVEASRKNLEQIFHSIDNTVNSTASVLEGVMNNITKGSLSMTATWMLSDIAKQELENRKKILDLQQQTTEAQIRQMESVTEMNKAKVKNMESGRANIEVSANNLEPELKIIMNKIIESVHISASMEGREYLLGDV